MIVDAIKKNVNRESLSSEEAVQAMKEIMSGSATPSQMSAFLVSLSMKGESIEEIIALGFAYYKGKLPDQLYKCIQFVLNFETSKRTTLIIVIIILIFYIGFSVNELSINEDGQWSDYEVLKKALEIWPSTESDDIYVQEQNSRYVRMSLLVSSLEIFQNIKILPFIASISLLIVVFFLTYQISHKRFSGIVSVLIVLQSHTFLHFDTIAIYENFWILFFLTSLYLINRKWQLSSVLYLLAVFSKAFIIVFFLPTIFYIYRAKIYSRKKLLVMCSYGGAVLVILAVFSTYRTAFLCLHFCFSSF